jgi:microcystin-dependent protein
VGQVALSDAAAPSPNWLPADGSLVQSMSHMALFNRITTTSGGDGEFTFATPNLPVPAAGMSWGICVTGSYPTPA